MREKYKKIIFLGLIFFIIFKNFLNASTEKIQGVPTRIIFIILDAARADRFSCYGYFRKTTPFIDEISKQGVLFKNNFSQSTETLKSIPSIFFSRYFTLPVFQDDAWRWRIKLENPETIFLKFDPEQVFLTDILKKHGYQTASFSEHLKLNMQSYFKEQFDYAFTLNRVSEINGDFEIKAQKSIAPIVKWLKNKPNKKIFLYWHIMFPHMGYPPGIEDKSFLKGVNLEDLRKTRIKINRRQSLKTKEEIECLNILYDSNLKFADLMVGKFYEELKKMGFENDTLLIITSDHGESLYDGRNRYGHKGPGYDNVTHVPLIISYPGKLPGGLTIEGLTELVDIAPTILDILKIPLPAGKSFDGQSLLPIIRGESDGKEFVFLGDAIRTKRYKYIASYDRLYDLEKDPQEKENIKNKFPRLKRSYKKLYELFTEPYLNRYLSAKRTEKINYSFYYTIDGFKNVPGKRIKRQNILPQFVEAYLSKNKISEPWLRIFTYSGRDAIYFNSRFKKQGFLSLLTKVPEGTYQVYLMMISSVPLNASCDQFDLRYVFNKEEKARVPLGRELFYIGGEKEYYYYLDLGKTQIKDNNFSLSIDFSPKVPGLFAIYHVKFVPEKSKKWFFKESADKRAKEFEKRSTRLKSLGYL